MTNVKLHGLHGNFLFALFLFFIIFSPLFAQNTAAVSLAGEISRLEKLSTAVSSAQERYKAFMDLARLYQLSGNSESVLKAYEGALAVSPGDGRALLEQGRFLISLGEYEKADAAINALLVGNRDKDLLIQGQYLAALLEAFRSGNLSPLAAMAEDPDFAEYRSSMYYTLWKLTGLTSWKSRLTTEFPQSPESKIVSGGVDSAATPLWLLFPGRSGLDISSPAAPAVPVSPPVPAIAPVSVPDPAASPAGNPAASALVLQTGLFSKEENAQVMAERLKKAGFTPQISRRSVNNTGYWAVLVSGGMDMNATLKKLKDAGFDAFPIKP